MDSLSTSLITPHCLPFIDSAKNAYSAYIKQSSFHNCEILVINLNLTHRSNSLPIHHNVNLGLKV